MIIYQPSLFFQKSYEPPEMPTKPYLAETFDGADVFKKR